VAAEGYLDAVMTPPRRRRGTPASGGRRVHRQHHVLVMESIRLDSATLQVAVNRPTACQRNDRDRGSAAGKKAGAHLRRADQCARVIDATGLRAPGSMSCRQWTPSER
jgi:hypothetical protein